MIAHPELIDTAIEESLRSQSPLQIGNRVKTADLELGGKKLPAGTYLHLSIAGANRDPKEFPEPERIDIARKPNRHVAFALGIMSAWGNTSPYGGSNCYWKVGQALSENYVFWSSDQYRPRTLQRF